MLENRCSVQNSEIVSNLEFLEIEFWWSLTQHSIRTRRKLVLIVLNIRKRTIVRRSAVPLSYIAINIEFALNLGVFRAQSSKNEKNLLRVTFSIKQHKGLIFKICHSKIAPKRPYKKKPKATIRLRFFRHQTAFRVARVSLLTWPNLRFEYECDSNGRNDTYTVI